MRKNLVSIGLLCVMLIVGMIAAGCSDNEGDFNNTDPKSITITGLDSNKALDVFESPDDPEEEPPEILWKDQSITVRVGEANDADVVANTDSLTWNQDALSITGDLKAGGNNNWTENGMYYVTITINKVGTLSPRSGSGRRVTIDAPATTVDVSNYVLSK